jgi:hypothetical protein
MARDTGSVTCKSRRLRVDLVGPVGRRSTFRTPSSSLSSSMRSKDNSARPDAEAENAPACGKTLGIK